MIQILTLLASVAAIAGPAAAADIHVSLVGKDARTVRADIVAAANAVCAEAIASDNTGAINLAYAYFQKEACVEATVKETYARMPRAMATLDRATSLR